MNWQQANNFSFYCYVGSKNLDCALVDQLKIKGRESPSGRARYCFHNDPSAEIQLMLIYHDERTDVPIHRHDPFGEFILLIEGAIELTTYSQEFHIDSKLQLSSSSGRFLPFWVEPGKWHKLSFKEPTIFYEMSQGPLSAKRTETTYITK